MGQGGQIASNLLGTAGDVAMAANPVVGMGLKAISAGVGYLNQQAELKKQQEKERRQRAFESLQADKTQGKQVLASYPSLGITGQGYMKYGGETDPTKVSTFPLNTVDPLAGLGSGSGSIELPKSFLQQLRSGASTSAAKGRNAEDLYEEESENAYGTTGGSMDAVRHAYATGANVQSQGLIGFAAPIAHEFEFLWNPDKRRAFSNDMEKGKPLSSILKETGQDLYNNIYGGFMGYTSENLKELYDKITTATDNKDLLYNSEDYIAKNITPFKKFGGKIPSQGVDYLAERNEVVSHGPGQVPSTDQNGDLNQLSQNFSQYDSSSDTHASASQGVGTSGGEFVYSDQLFVKEEDLGQFLNGII